jgi:predicted O-methyltransferase YrrM
MNNIPGFMSHHECGVLRELFSKYNTASCVGVEIGSFLGRSSWEISHSIPLGKLYCMDAWNNWEFTRSVAVHKSKLRLAAVDTNYNGLPDIGTKCSLDEFLKNTKECTNITTIRAVKPSDIPDWDEPIDFLFLDAAHTNPSDKVWLDYWLPKIKPGGRLVGHDFNMNDLNRFPDVYMNIKYLQTVLNQRVKTTRTVDYESTIWYFDL